MILQSMNSVKQFNIIIKSFTLRYVKEINNNNDISVKKITNDIFHFIDTYQYIDDVIEDVINIILNSGDITIDRFISDINHSYKHGKLIPINDRKELIKFFKYRMANRVIITQPLMFFMSWSSTISGREYYSKLNTKVNDILSNNIDYLNTINKIIHNM